MDYKHTLDYLGNQVESPQDIIPKGIRRCDDPLLCIPRDLALHWGPLYKSNHYGEWHYFSMIGKEENGDDFSLFYVVRSTGWCEQILVRLCQPDEEEILQKLCCPYGRSNF